MTSCIPTTLPLSHATPCSVSTTRSMSSACSIPPTQTPIHFHTPTHTRTHTCNLTLSQTRPSQLCLLTTTMLRPCPSTLSRIITSARQTLRISTSSPLTPLHRACPNMCLFNLVFHVFIVSDCQFNVMSFLSVLCSCLDPVSSLPFSLSPRSLPPCHVQSRVSLLCPLFILCNATVIFLLTSL